MDLFPDGGFVRLRSRARDKYLHADEDECGVSLRPLGAAPSVNAVWKVEHWPVEGGGGDAFFLLQGAAYGRYLSVTKLRSSRGHRGVRVLQRDYTSEYLEPSFVWTPQRVEAGQNYVRLHNDEQRCLHAKGNLVTADARNGNETTMMQWRVEAIPFPPPPQPLECCYACGREGSAPICRRCAVSLKTTLLDVAKGKLKDFAQKYYCLECKGVFAEMHKEHEEKTLLLGRYKGQPVAWLTGEGLWTSLFESIETIPDRAIQPHLIYTPQVPRCDVCRDVISTDRLYGVLCRYCTLQCYAARDGGEEEKAITALDYSGAIGFCLTCAALITRGEGNRHKEHDWLSVRIGSDGARPRLVLPDDHPKQKDWSTVNKGSAGNEILIRDDETVRCFCGKRVLSAVSCSLQCLLDAAVSREPQFFLPRPLLARQSLI